jgi:hypothetical protein
MKNLVLAPVGNNSKHRMWFSGSGRTFDFIALCYEPVDSAAVSDADDVFTSTGYKYSNAKKYWEVKEEALREYDFIFMPDDDIEIDTGGINELFRTAHAFSLDLCQPSLTADSAHSWPITITHGRPDLLLRLTNFVEIMCPLFSRNAFSLCVETFGHNTVGMGLDFVWPKLLGFKGIGIIETVQARHRGPLRQWSDLIDSEKEWDSIRKRFGAQRFEHMDYKYALRPGSGAADAVTARR